MVNRTRLEEISHVIADEWLCNYQVGFGQGGMEQLTW